MIQEVHGISMKIEETLTRMSHPLVLFFISNKHMCVLVMSILNAQLIKFMTQKLLVENLKHFLECLYVIKKYFFELKVANWTLINGIFFKNSL